MSQKEFLSILSAVIILSGGYYLYANEIWPFSPSGNSANIAAAGNNVYAVSAVAKEVYDSVIVVEILNPYSGGLMGEMRAAIDGSTDIFSYDQNLNRQSSASTSIAVGDKLAITSDTNLAGADSGSFLASSIAVFK